MFKTSMKKKREENIKRYQRVFNSEDGKIVLRDLMKVCHLADLSMLDGDTHETAFREGERSVILRILKTINADPYDSITEYFEDNQEEQV